MFINKFTNELLSLKKNVSCLKMDLVDTFATISSLSSYLKDSELYSVFIRVFRYNRTVIIFFCITEETLNIFFDGISCVFFLKLCFFTFHPLSRLLKALPKQTQFLLDFVYFPVLPPTVRKYLPLNLSSLF